MNRKILGARIRQARRAMPPQGGRRVTQEEFARLLDVHWTTVSAWERSANEPTAANLAAIAARTNRPVEYFFADATHDGDLDAVLRQVAEGLVTAFRAALDDNERTEVAP